MYTQRRSGIRLFPLIVLGVIAGIAFMIYDGAQKGTLPFLNNAPAEDGNIMLNATPLPVQEAASTSNTTTTSDDTSTASTSALSPDIPAGTKLFIPSAGIYADIVRVYLDGESWDVSRLGQNVGHLQGTSWVDTPGNVVLSGHVELSDGRVGIFSNLDELQVGDMIEIQQGDQTWRYSIVSVGTTTPEDLTPLYPTSDSQLTLITCGSYDFFQDAYLERMVIVAQQVS